MERRKLSKMTREDVSYIFASKERYKWLLYRRELALRTKLYSQAKLLLQEALSLRAEIKRKYDIIL